MKRFGDLYDRISSYDNLLKAHMMARKGKAHYREVKKLNEDPEGYLKNLEWHLKNETYYVTASDYRIQKIVDRGKERELKKLSYYPHRIVQWAVMLQIEHILTRHFIHNTFASIPGRGLHGAADIIKRDLKNKEETKYCLKIDVKKFYPSIDNKILYALLEKKIKDKRLLRLLKIIIFSVGDKGQPIGSLWSQYAGNYYLSGLDHHIKENYRVKYYYRYCDDIVILHSDKKYLHELRKEIQRYISENLNLTLKENWQVFPVDIRGIDFLGYRFFRNYALLRKRTAKKLKRKISRIKNKRILSFTDVCTLNSYLGWTKHCDSYRFNQKYFEPLQGKRYYNHESDIKNIKLEVKKYE